VGGFDDVVFFDESLGEKAGEFFEHFVAFRSARAVVDDDDGGFHGEAPG
jgi:hypothetical protein